MLADRLRRKETRGGALWWHVSLTNRRACRVDVLTSLLYISFYFIVLNKNCPLVFLFFFVYFIFSSTSHRLYKSSESCVTLSANGHHGEAGAVANRDVLHETTVSNQPTKRPATWGPGKCTRSGVRGRDMGSNGRLFRRGFILYSKRRRCQRPERCQLVALPCLCVCGCRHKAALLS